MAGAPANVKSIVKYLPALLLCSAVSVSAFNAPPQMSMPQRLACRSRSAAAATHMRSEEPLPLLTGTSIGRRGVVVVVTAAALTHRLLPLLPANAATTTTGKRKELAAAAANAAAAADESEDEDMMEEDAVAEPVPRRKPSPENPPVTTIVGLQAGGGNPPRRPEELAKCLFGQWKRGQLLMVNDCQERGE